MITFFNKLGNSWVAKIILGILALSMMAFWGLGGLTNLNMGSNDALTVGKISVSTQQLAQKFENQRKELSRQVGGKYISPAQALELGLLQKVLQEEVIDLVRYQIKEDLGLAASNEAVQKYVESNPIFKDSLGNFDKNMFYAFLSQRGLSETGLALELKDKLAYNHLQDSINEVAYTSTQINHLSYLSSNELRNVTALFLKPSDLIINEKPTDEDLTNYYEGYSENFMKPEYRKIRLLQLTPGMMDKFISIDEKEINDTYEFEKNKYDQPEERELLQILFKSKEEAQNALTTLTPENFEKTALDMGQSIESTYFGMTKKEQLSETLQEPVFNVAANSITQPIETEMGWQIFFVKNIKAAQKADENVVKTEIKKSLINNKAYDKLAEISRKVEDLLGEGKNLTDAAKELTLETIEIPLLDISGIDTKGVTNTVVSPALMQEVFTLNVGDISSLVEHNNGYLIGEVVEIDPVGVKPFDQVKEDVVKLFISEKQKEKFETTVQALAQKAIKGTTLEKLSQGAEGSFKLEKAEKLTRTTENNLFKAHIQTIFNQKTGLENTSFVIAPNKQGAAIITVTSIQLPDFNDKNVDLTATQTNEKNINANALNEAVFNDYMNKLNVKVYQKAIGQIASMYKNQE